MRRIPFYLVPIAFLFSFIAPLPASIITVSSTANAGANSLREAVANANPGDTIDFQDPLGTIMLTSQITISKNLVIIGNDTTKTVIDGQGVTRIFQIDPTDTVQIRSLTIRNGGSVEEGGGIHNAGHLSLHHCLLLGNTATAATTDAKGGGIFSQGGSLSITSTVLRGNGAVAVSPGFRGVGGGVNNNNGPLSIVSSSFRENKAQSSTFDAYGGAIFNSLAPMNIASSTFWLNVAVAPASGIVVNTLGGAIVNFGGRVTVRHSVLNQNRSASNESPLSNSVGGAIFNMLDTMSIDSCVISENVVSSSGIGKGGGIYNTNQGTILMDSTQVIENQVHSGTDVPGQTCEGGGIYSDGKRIVIDHSLISKNIVQTLNQGVTGLGGGISNSNGSSGSISHSTLQLNAASSYISDAYGGGIFNSESPLTIEASTLDTNIVISLGPGGQNTLGGGLVNFDGVVTIRTCTFSGNFSTTSGPSSNAVGGAIHNLSNDMSIRSSTFTQNHALAPGGNGWGGAIYKQGGTVTILNSILWADTASSSGQEIFGVVDSFAYSVVEGLDLPTLYPGSIGNLDGTDPGSDPFLGPLQNNGGPTQTHALLCGSAAWEAGDPSLTDPDQRGETVSGIRDMGAFEAQTDLTDSDGDGWCGEFDCDDTNPDINPDQEEICNNFDDDCDGVVGTPDVGDYCCAFGPADGYYINRIQSTLNGVDNTSGDDDGYGDYTSYVLSVNPYFPYLYLIIYPGGVPGMKHLQVFADWDQDNAFSQSEKEVDYCTSIQSAWFIPVPAGFTGSTRLRVLVRPVSFGCSPSDLPSDACGEIGGGEVEDYTVEKAVPLVGNGQLTTDNGGLDITISPNPVSDEFFLKIIDPLDSDNYLQNPSKETEIGIDVLNGMGQTALRKTVEYTGDPIRLDASSFVSGTYFLRVKTGKGIIVKTMVKQ